MSEQHRVPTPRDLLAAQAGPPTPEGAWWRQVASEVRWSFTPPLTWLAGVGVNLVLALLWLLVAPVVGRPHRDWVILIGTYFAVWILADVTTTNVLGADAVRVRVALLRGVALSRLLLVKNVALLIIVGLPTLIATAILTVLSEADYRLTVTLPGVAFAIFVWLGVGNVVSVLLPVAATPLRQRWAQRRQWRSTVRWLVHLALPYALLLPMDPLTDAPGGALGSRLLPGLEDRGLALTGAGLLAWGLGTVAALAVDRWRPIRIR